MPRTVEVRKACNNNEKPDCARSSGGSSIIREDGNAACLLRWRNMTRATRRAVWCGLLAIRVARIRSRNTVSRRHPSAVVCIYFAAFPEMPFPDPVPAGVRR